MFRIYSKEQKSKEIFNVNLTAAEVKIVMENNLFLDHPELNKEDYIIVEQENPFVCPIYDAEKNIVEEATREQRILLFQEIDLLQDGEYIDEKRIVTVPCTENFFRKTWDKELHIWKEGATEEEIKTAWFDNINKWKPQVLEGPFSYVHSDGKTYKQKLRVGKDDALLSTAIQALIRNAEIPSIEWAFDDENNSVLMTLEDLRKLQDTGFVWTQCVYEAERELKAMEADFTKDINFFRETAIKHIGKYKMV
jgi:hypothetical protein|nr:MAG TPA: hypothetical protein [Caudoviricetes sp.]